MKLKYSVNWLLTATRIDYSDCGRGEYLILKCHSTLSIYVAKLCRKRPSICGSGVMCRFTFHENSKLSDFSKSTEQLDLEADYAGESDQPGAEFDEEFEEADTYDEEEEEVGLTAEEIDDNVQEEADCEDFVIGGRCSHRQNSDSLISGTRSQ